MPTGSMEIVKVWGRKTGKRSFIFIKRRNKEIGVALFWDMTLSQWIPTFRENGVMKCRQAPRKITFFILF